MAADAREPDRIDTLVAGWEQERPGIDTATMALVARLLAVAGEIGRRLDEFAAQHGLDRGQGDVLLTLLRSGSPYTLSPSRLADSLLVTSGTMTNRLDRLEERGLIERVPNPADRRGMDVKLTAAGRKLTAELVGKHVENERRMLAGLSARERGELDRLARKLLATLS
jgi:DNA-binding MarR family transcriptional regulator